MENVCVKMLESFKTFAKGEVYEIDSETAAKWFDLGLAEKSEAADQIDAKLAKLEKALEEREERLLETITKAVSQPVRLPAVARDDSDKNFGDFLQLVAKGDREVIGKKYGSSYATVEKSQNTLSGVAGGYTIPVEYSNKMVEVTPEETIVRPRADVHTMTSNTKKLLASKQTVNMYGGVLVYHKKEGAALTESQASFREIELHARDLTALVYVTNDMLEDGPGIANHVLKNGKAAIMGREDKEFLVGVGVEGAHGIYNSPAAISVTRTTASTIKFEDVVNMESKLIPSSRGRAVWVCSQSAIPALAYLKDGAGNPIYLENGRGAGFPTLRGIPVVFSGRTPVLGSLGDFALCDFGYYAVGSRSDMVVSFSEHTRFGYNESAFRIVHRYDGQNTLDAPVLLDNGTTTVSNVVLLAA